MFGAMMLKATTINTSTTSLFRKANILALGSLVVSLCLYSASSIAADSNIHRQISVSGNGEAFSEADTATVFLNTQSQNKTSAEAKQAVDTSVNKLIEVLTSVGIEESALVAGQISLSPRYDYRNNTRVFSGYTASRSIQVEIDALDKLNPFLDAALAAQIDGINNIQYRSSEADSAKALARELAIKDSKDKAAFLAESYDASLGPVISINYHTHNSSPVYPMPEMARMSVSADAGGQYIPDQLSYSDSISVVFELIAE